MRDSSRILVIVIATTLLAACPKQPLERTQMPPTPATPAPASTGASNPLISPPETPFGVPAFDQIETGHYLPAFQAGIEQTQAEIAAIASRGEPATFANTLAAMDGSGALLRRVERVFFGLLAAHTNDAMQKIAKQVAPQLAGLQDDILMNAELFRRVKVVHERQEELGLDPEQKTLLKRTYRDFIRGGANLSPDDQAQLRRINKELALLEVQFNENVLGEDNGFKLVLEAREQLQGLPPSVIASAADAAKEAGQAGKWVFTLHKPSLIPFLTYSAKRPLRQKMLQAYISRGDSGNERDNKEILARIAALRVDKARLLGHESYAHFVLEENMAQTPAAVHELLDRLWKAALPVARREVAQLQKLARAEGQRIKIEPWDWWYYAERLRKQRYALDDAALRPYFKLDNVRDGAFAVAGKLFGLKFEQRHDIPRYHADVQAFEVKEQDGTHVGILLLDYFPRESKRGGAWMGAYRQQQRRDGARVAPVICNVLNVTKPTGETPALLSMEEVTTLFHEFGHALHGLLSDVTYLTLSGTSVPRDFVELPSQVMENWATDPEVLALYARHYQTGEPIPATLVDKIRKSRHFNQGFETVEYLAAALLDMSWHTLTAPPAKDVTAFETAALTKIGLIPEIVVRYRSTYFRHIFSAGYASGYYSYIWSAVLDADAFQAFKETSIFDQKTARAFRAHVLSRGGAEEPMTLYRRFRGRDPKIEPLLERRGLK